MANKLERKCAQCKSIIEINSNNISGVLSFQGKYYHAECFKEMATKKAISNRGKPEIWKNALDNIQTIETETKKMLKQSFAKDSLNEWLLNNYNITVVSSTVWQRIADLERGVYKGKKCKPVSMETLLGAWKWGQVKLNKINTNNKMHNNGPSCDEERLIYDLAVLVGKVPNYLAYKAKQEIRQAEIATQMPRINYNNMQRTEIKHEGLDDISDLLNDDDDDD